VPSSEKASNPSSVEDSIVARTCSGRGLGGIYTSRLSELGRSS
jgi:hypothetical protein